MSTDRKSDNKPTSDNNQMSANKQVVRRFMDECWNQGKVDAVRELMADNCRHHDPVFPSLTSGADNVKRHIANCRSGFPDLKFTIDDTIAERNEASFTGPHTDRTRANSWVWRPPTSTLPSPAPRSSASIMGRSPNNGSIGTCSR